MSPSSPLGGAASAAPSSGIFATRSLDHLRREAESGALRRALGPVSLTALGVGGIIGAGIFVLTGQAAAAHAGQFPRALSRGVARPSIGGMTFPPRVGVGIIVHRMDEVLLIRRASSHGSGTWSTPGGHIDPGESLEECAAREALEETGVEVQNIRFRAVTNDVFEDEGKHYVTVWMEADYRSGEASVTADYELTEVGWFPWDALPEPLFLPLENLLAGRCYGSPGEL